MPAPKSSEKYKLWKINVAKAMFGKHRISLTMEDILEVAKYILKDYDIRKGAGIFNNLLMKKCGCSWNTIMRRMDNDKEFIFNKLEVRMPRRATSIYAFPYSKKLSYNTRDKISKSVKVSITGDKNPRFRHDIDKKSILSLCNLVKKTNVKLNRNEFVNFFKNYFDCSHRVFINRFGSIDEMIRQSGIEIVTDKSRIGKNETFLLDQYEKFIGYGVIRQHYVKGYVLDGYIPELNVAIEVDENHHFTSKGKLRIEDIIRQQKIQSLLKCRFIRLVDDICLGNHKEQTLLEEYNGISNTDC
jgi:hypothetical protein